MYLNMYMKFSTFMISKCPFRTINEMCVSQDRLYIFNWFSTMSVKACTPLSVYEGP